MLACFCFDGVVIKRKEVVVACSCGIGRMPLCRPCIVEPACHHAAQPVQSKVTRLATWLILLILLQPLQMTYMRPFFVPVPVPSSSHKYGLFLYREAGLHFTHHKKAHNSLILPFISPSPCWHNTTGLQLQGLPVLFIPGNGGSGKQVRSLASVAAKFNHEQVFAHLLCQKDIIFLLPLSTVIKTNIHLLLNQECKSKWQKPWANGIIRVGFLCSTLQWRALSFGWRCSSWPNRACKSLHCSHSVSLWNAIYDNFAQVGDGSRPFDGRLCC